MVPGVEWDNTLTRMHEKTKHLGRASRYLQNRPQRGLSHFGIAERLQLDPSKAGELTSGILR
jgi:hypothetical protein